MRSNTIFTRAAAQIRIASMTDLLPTKGGAEADAAITTARRPSAPRAGAKTRYSGDPSGCCAVG